MDTYIICITLIGLVAISMSWIKHLTHLINISYTIIYMVLGAILFSFIHELPWASPYRSQAMTMHLAEIMVIVAIMATGLKIDRPLKLRHWSAPLRLVVFTMLICITVIAAMGYWWLGLGAASAVLLGAVLAPTDPVLAGDVQVGPPNSKEAHDVKFVLTAEAGMNDGLAFPFVWLAVSIAAATVAGEAFSLGEWALFDVVYRIVAGIVIGFLTGKAVAYFFFYLPEKFKAHHVQQGLVAFSATLLVYGLTEMCHGYGFIAVFVTAITIRTHELKHEYHRTLHDFIEQIEHILLAVLLILFGGSLVDGILAPLTWEMALCGILFLFVVRPVSVYIGLAGHKLPAKDKWVIGFLGIRGIGSFFYLAFALNESEFPDHDVLWAGVAFIVLSSIIIHGLSANIILKKMGYDDA